MDNSISIALTARRWGDQTLLEVGYALEQSMDIKSKLKLVVRPEAELWEADQVR